MIIFFIEVENIVNNKPAANRKRNVHKRRMIGLQATIVKPDYKKFMEDTFDHIFSKLPSLSGSRNINSLVIKALEEYKCIQCKNKNVNRSLQIVNLPNTIDWLKRKHDDVMKLEKAGIISEKVWKLGTVWKQL